MRRSAIYALAALAALLSIAVLAVVMLNVQGEDELPSHAAAFESSPAMVERGRYLALAGNCAGCHTPRGGVPYAGGVGIDTPFGAVYASNLTSSKTHGIGQWSAAEFWRAMHNGRSRDGRLLYPAFPYPSFTTVTRGDSDAIYAYLRTVPPAETPNKAHALRFPYDTQAALAVWRAVAFRPGGFEPAPTESAAWNRGAYLVGGLGHCIACHGARDSLGATVKSVGLSGGNTPVDAWLAPSLVSASADGQVHWSQGELAQFLKTGSSPRGAAMGPMADVVFNSTQHLADADVDAIATYLQRLPTAAVPAPAPRPASMRRDAATMARGAKVYDQQCAYCHGDQGQGKAGDFPPLAGNRGVTAAHPANLIQIVRLGGYPPTTQGNPRPAGMPPFGSQLDDSQIAAVLTYVRASWGNDAPAVTSGDTLRR
ncbi:c-type cytochrome [Variovorax sp. J22R133]|uniref:c-type cytochrome n=1 Tax=Variovorax brevis TaxID=3053503 RepID=UPI002578BC6C|nr:c-type cytochrome [Variovorax sp. J22R133]MDM0115145.1 c-type cytochrome [Variovorax sp. J22R133]